jgi:magnesium transporter
MRQTIDITDIRQMIFKKDIKNLKNQLRDYHPVDIADILIDLSPDMSLKLFNILNMDTASEVLAVIDSEKRYFILTGIKPLYAAMLLENMSSDDMTDFLGDLDKKAKEKILSLLEIQDQIDLKGLLQYDRNTAGGLMTTEYIAFPQHMKAEEALNRLGELAPDAETIYYVYVVDSENRLVGVVSLRDLILAPADTPISRFMWTNVKKVEATLDQEKVARFIQKYGLLALPVVDNRDTLLGIITVDDVMEVVEEEVTEDILKLSGSDEKPIPAGSSAWLRAKRRLPWILIAVFGEIISGNVINNFSHAIQTFVALSFFIPVLMDMGGNVGTQSAAIVVRGLATGEINNYSLAKNLLREAIIGIILGAVNGILVATVAYIWQKEIKFGIVVGIAMAFNLTFAAVLGTFVPLLWHKLGRDPAVASGPLVTTLLDITGLFIYFSAAIFLMKI